MSTTATSASPCRVRSSHGGRVALQAVKERIETLGFYHITLDEGELHAMQEDQGRIDEGFRRQGRERLERWIALADSGSPAPT